MWHVETDFFAMAIFLIMLIKEHLQRRQRRSERDVQASAFYLVLIFSIVNDAIDILSSLAMNDLPGWWAYETIMTVYVASMPLLAAVWVAYAYVLIHKEYPVKRLRRDITFLMIPYAIYILLALSNPFTGLFFRLSETMEYTRGIFFMPVGVGFIMLYSAVGMLLVLINWRRIAPRSNAVLLMAFFLTTACFIWIQLANPGWLIINASYATVYVWCDFTVEERRRNELYLEINRKNRELKEIAKKAESAAQAKTEFLSRMSHDIRTPMNAIIGLTHLAQQEKDPAALQEYLQKISASSDFLLGLINDILDMSKIENGELTLTPEPLTKAEFAASIDTVIRPLMDEKHIQFSCDLQDGPECILVDPLRFNQIFFNLLSNAAKFTLEGGTVDFQLERLPDREEKVGLRMTVRDNGIGMSQEFLKHIYDPFSQEHTRSVGTAVGTGLGLPIVKSLVDAMEGTISVRTALGEGTEFVVELYVPEVEPEEKNPAESVSAVSLKDARILLVEDNDINIYVAQLILEDAGCIVTVAKNGQEALDAVEASPVGWFHAILMDVRMPVMDGVEATRRIRALERADAKTVPIIAMTADAFTQEQKRTLDAGMNCHLSKPINPQLLYQELSTYIRR